MPSPGGLHPDVSTAGVLSTGRGRPAGTLSGRLVWALLVVVAAKCGACGLSLVVPGTRWRVGGTPDIPVEALFPQGRTRFELGSSGWSRVLGIDAVGGPPHCDLADEGRTRVASRWCPEGLGVTLIGVGVNLVGEVGDQLGSRCQVLTPHGMGMDR